MSNGPQSGPTNSPAKVDEPPVAVDAPANAPSSPTLRAGAGGGRWLSVSCDRPAATAVLSRRSVSVERGARAGRPQPAPAPDCGGRPDSAG